MSIIAEFAQVKIGTLSIDGFMDKDGNFYVAGIQIAELLSIPQKNIGRDLKGILGQGFGFLKLCVKNARNSVSETTYRNSGYKGDLNAVNIADFQKVLLAFDRKGNKIARQLMDILVGLSLHQLFCDAFGIKFESEERQAWLVARMESKEFFFELTEQIEAWYSRTSAERSQDIETYFVHSFNGINRGLFGKTSKEIRTEIGAGKNELIRDYFNREAIRRITQVQSIAANQMKDDTAIRPLDAVKFALKVSRFPIADYSKDAA